MARANWLIDRGGEPGANALRLILDIAMIKHDHDECVDVNHALSCVGYWSIIRVCYDASLRGNRLCYDHGT